MVDLAVNAGAAFIKNASGGAVGIATPEDMRYLRGRAPASVGVKASGGIKNLGRAASGSDRSRCRSSGHELGGGDFSGSNGKGNTRGVVSRQSSVVSRQLSVVSRQSSICGGLG